MAAESPPPTGLPVEEVVDDVRRGLDGGAAVLQAEPGAGKTTLVPLRLLDEGWLAGQRIVVLEPRRVAARAAAARMAALLGEEVGATVGYVTRDDRRTGRSTRVEVVTEGVLTRRLQADPSLPGTGLVVFDEFHERHLQADLGLALTLDARDALRPDLRVLVMSATLDAAPVSALMGSAAVVRSAGRTFPVEVRYDAGRPGPRIGPRIGPRTAAAVRQALARDGGDVLVFLPGVGEIRAVAEALGAVADVDVLALHGRLPAAEQDRALRPGPRRRVVLATDLAETSVTVEGVGVVVDAGLARRPEYDPASGLTRLRTVVASRAAADQRAGRAGRLGPGVAYRLWAEAEHSARRPWPDPEIVAVDLAGLVLELAVWGADAGDLRWLDPPPAAAVATATSLLEDLGALDGGRPTEMGRRLVRLPVHPRLGTMLLTAPSEASGTAALLAALLSERDVLRPGGGVLTADVAARLAVLRRRGALDARVGDGGVVDGAAVAAVRRRAEELARRAGLGPLRPDRAAVSHGPTGADPGPLLAQAYPDRLAQSRGGGRYRLRHGGGAALGALDPLAGTPWLVAADVEGPGGGPGGTGGGPGGGTGRADGRIRLAAAIDGADVELIGGDHIRTEMRLEWDATAGDLRAVQERTLDALVLDSRSGPATAGPATTAALVARAAETGVTELGWTAAARALQNRAGWARRALGPDWPDVSDAGLAATAGDWLAGALAGAIGRADLARVDPAAAIRRMLGPRAGELDRLLPASVELVSGRRVPVDYSGERPRIAARAQDLYGTRVHPTVAAGRVPVTVEVLSPAGRPIQVTSDLPAFWAGSWREVRKEMAGRYPKHFWPEDPAAPAAARNEERTGPPDRAGRASRRPGR